MMFLPFEHLYWHRFKLFYRPQKAGLLSRHNSTAIRGMLGDALQKQDPELFQKFFVCPIPERHPYARRYASIPAPYILSTPFLKNREISEHELIPVTLTLIGNAIDDFPRLIKVMENFGGHSMGHQQIPLQLEDMKILSPGKVLFFPPDLSQSDVYEQVRIHWKTPFRTKWDPNPPDFKTLLHRIAERCALLAHFYTDCELIDDFSPWLEMTNGMENLSNDLIWKTLYAKTSGRTGEKMDVAGWSGTQICGSFPARLYPFLYAGSQLHVGKATVWGMGRFVFTLKEYAEKSQTAATD